MKYDLPVDTTDFPFIIINNIFFVLSLSNTTPSFGVRRINKIFTQTPIKSTIKSYGILTPKMKRQYHAEPYHLRFDVCRHLYDIYIHWSEYNINGQQNGTQQKSNVENDSMDMI